MAIEFDEVSFYFFDFDDNIMFLTTPIFILNTETEKPEPFSTGEFANIHPLLGQPGKWENYAMFDGSYRNFRDIPEDELQPGQKQYFVEDVEKALDRRSGVGKRPPGICSSTPAKNSGPSRLSPRGATVPRH